MMCYTEIGPEKNFGDAYLFTGKSEKKLWDWLRLIEDKDFKRVRIVDHKDIWKSFKKLFGAKT